MAGGLVIKGVTVIDGTGAEPRAAVDVTIRDGRFELIAPAGGSGTAGMTALDGNGKFLLPGLWEGHTHLRPLLTDDAQSGQAKLDAALGDYCSHGITTVLDLGGPIDQFHAYRQWVNAEGVGGRAQVLFAGPSFTGVNGWPLPLHHNPAMVYQVGSAVQARDVLARQLDRQPDVVKIIYDGEPGSPEKLPREALAVIAAEAHRRNTRALVHVHSAQDCLDALEAGVDGIEHSFLPTPGQEQDEVEQVTEALLRTGAYLTPTLAVWEQLGRAGDSDYLDELTANGFMTGAEREAFPKAHPGWGQFEFPHHPRHECRDRLEAGFRMLPRMHAAGVRLAVGSDIAPIVSRPMTTLREMALLAQAGVPAGDVLRGASQHAAAKVGLAETVGTIQPDMVADAILLDADPRQDLGVLICPGRVAAVIRAGDVSSSQAGVSA